MTSETQPRVAVREREKRAKDDRAKSGRLSGIAMPAGFFVLCILVWEAWTRLFDVSEQILPAPSAIIARTFDDWDYLWPHTLVTLQEAVYGFGLGALVGFVLGVVIAANRLIERALYPLLITSQAVPKLAIAPMLVIWFGYGIMPKVVITALIVFFPVAVTTAEGMKSVDKNLLDLLKSVNASRWQLFVKVRVPHAIPQIMSGLMIGVTLCVVGAAVGEWVGAQKGLGYLIVAANGQLDTTLAFSSILILVIMGVGLFALLALFERLLTPWRQK